MNDFFVTALTFPTLPWSVVLLFCVVYWLMAATGLFDFHHHVDGWADTAHGHGPHHSHGTHHGHHDDHSSQHHGVAGILARLGLSGVPFMVMLVILSFVGWMTTYYVHLLLLSGAPVALRIVLGVATLAGSLVVAVFTTAIVLRPIRTLLARFRPPETVSLLGRVGTVISPAVDARGGRVEVADGGAGLILQARAPEGASYPRGAQVVVTAHRPADHAYDVVSQSEFNKP